ncbi:hypothetical protein BJ912DRAFT_1025110 [Pholiota molesta]|nr:hypothetical protein BJ912DRAFT_1025110 [Pholiota molesta]
MSSPKKTATGSFTLPPVHSDDWEPSSQNAFPRSTLDDDIDIIDYATSGNFEVEFGLESMSLQQSHNNEQESTPQQKRSRNDDGWHPLRQWEEYDRERDIAEVLRFEGRCGYANASLCHECSDLPALYRCVDCEVVEMFCAPCLVQIHELFPLHCIKKWNGTFFERATLRQLGLRVQLGHPAHEACVSPQPSMNDIFTVVHSNGVHEIALDFCNCETAQSHAVQIIRRFWFPSTGIRPQSAATIRVLKLFHFLAFEGKCSPYEYYNSLARATDNTGIYNTKDRYDEFMRMYRKWSNLTMAKRGGRGHDMNGVSATAPGECALLCPACPQPGKNLPPDWEDAPPEKSWLYSLFLAIDANFRLTRKHVSSEERDPSLSDGWAFFVKNEPYQAYIKANWAEPQPRSSCVNHEAVNNPNKEVKGKAVTGGGTADCARHNMKRPCGFADLQKGERYINMDYLVFSSLRGRSVQRLVLSYDIACQWYKNIWSRMRILPQDLWLDKIVKTTMFLVPKFHLPAHIAECNLNFSFNLSKHVGRTDGEAPERGWSRTNQLATSTSVCSTREMGPGFRRDTLDDHFNDWNWKKITGLGASLWKKLKVAVPKAAEQASQFESFSSTISKDNLSAFQSQVEAWEEDIKQLNPFKPTIKHRSEQDVKLEFAKEAAAEAAKDTATIHADMHPSELIAQGLQLEDQQQRLHVDIAGLGQHPTSNQLRLIQETSNRLQRRIIAWIQVQTFYIPHISLLREADLSSATAKNGGVPPEPKVEKIALYLPSILDDAQVTVPNKFYEYEWRLCEGQAYGALHDIRQNYRIKTHFIKHKTRFSRGVAQNTRSSATINTTQAKIIYAATKYRIARAALLQLASKSGIDKVCPPNWQENLKELRDQDLRGMSEGLTGQTEGRRTLSWIWLAEGVKEGEDNEQMHEALRIEWCHMRARVMRWSEEVQLLQEEMRRVLAFLEWQSEWWRKCGGDLSHVVDPVIKEGMIAYRERQASIRLALRDRFQNLWHGRDELMNEVQMEIFSGNAGPEVD